jgi:phosphohistidine phosphatase
MQHGLAVSEEADPERPLSPAGREQIEVSARAIRRMGLQFATIVASPRRRSRQTAEIVAAAVGYKPGKIAEIQAFAPSGDPIAAIETLARVAKDPAVFVAGHLPTLAKVSSLLLAERSPVRIQIENGALCRIDVEALPTHEGVLRWYLTHDHLRLIAG